jgi:hypothetical protein
LPALAARSGMQDLCGREKVTAEDRGRANYGSIVDHSINSDM